MDHRKYAQQNLSEGKTPKEVTAMLIEEGIPYSEAVRIVNQVSKTKEKSFSNSIINRNKKSFFALALILLLIFLCFGTLNILNISDTTKQIIPETSNSETPTTVPVPTTMNTNYENALDLCEDYNNFKSPVSCREAVETAIAYNNEEISVLNPLPQMPNDNRVWEIKFITGKTIIITNTGQVMT